MRLLRAINRAWAADWEISLWGLVTRGWDAVVDRYLVPRDRS